MNREIRADISDIGVDASERVNDAVGRKLFCQAEFASKPDSRRLLRLYEFGFKQKSSRTFGEYFAIWRKHFQIAEKHREKYMKWLSGEVDKRVEGVVGGGHRKSYYKAAELIVMLGALREEKGEMTGIYELVEHYKRMHSRKYAFRNEIDELEMYN